MTKKKDTAESLLKRPKKYKTMQEGISGKIAHFFINSKLTILLMIGLMVIGVYSSFLIPSDPS